MLAGLGYMLSQSRCLAAHARRHGFFLVEVFISCLFCHTEAYALRPKRTSESTLFYLFFAAGGALGSFLIGIASPLIFSFNYDLALTFLVTALLRLRSHLVERLAATPAMVHCQHSAARAGLHASHRVPAGHALAVRNFYGSLRVRQSSRLSRRHHAHPHQRHHPARHADIFCRTCSKTPTTYYAEDSGVGLALRFCCQGRARNIGVIGLGVGTIAAYGHPGDRIRFYEINPAVAPIAQHLFTYHPRFGRPGRYRGRRRPHFARRRAPQNFDVLVIDAFSGDAIPLHLLTTQAVALYKRHLAPGGILAFHISNQHVDLEPEIALLAKAAGMQAMRVSSLADEQRGEYTATWMLLTDNADFFTLPEVAAHAKSPVENPNAPPLDRRLLQPPTAPPLVATAMGWTPIARSIVPCSCPQSQDVHTPRCDSIRFLSERRLADSSSFICMAPAQNLYGRGRRQTGTLWPSNPATWTPSRTSPAVPVPSPIPS